MEPEQWRKMDDYYWVGPPGWTICRVIVRGEEVFELWRSDQSTRTGVERSLAGAKTHVETLRAAGEPD